MQIFKNKIWKYVLRLFYSPSLKCMRTKVLPTIMDIQNPYLRDRTKKLYCITSYSVGAVYHDLVVFRKKWRWLEDGCCHRWWCLMFTRYQKDLVMMCGFKNCNWVFLHFRKHNFSNICCSLHIDLLGSCNLMLSELSWLIGKYSWPVEEKSCFHLIFNKMYLPANCVRIVWNHNTIKVLHLKSSFPFHPSNR